MHGKDAVYEKTRERDERTADANDCCFDHNTLTSTEHTINALASPVSIHNLNILKSLLVRNS